MTKTLGQMHTGVRDRLGEATARAWTDVQLKNWILEGARDVARRAECLWAVLNKATSAGVGTVPLTGVDPGIVRIHKVEWTPTLSGAQLVYPLEYRDRYAMDSVWGTQQNISQGYAPMFYTLWGATPALSMQLFPIPSIAGIAQLYYYALPKDLVTTGSADNSLIDCPEGWEDVIMDYAEYHALRQDRDERWKDVMGSYEQRLVDLAATTIRPSDQSGWITSGAGFIPGWLTEGY